MVSRTYQDTTHDTGMMKYDVILLQHPQLQSYLPTTHSWCKSASTTHLQYLYKALLLPITRLCVRLLNAKLQGTPRQCHHSLYLWLMSIYSNITTPTMLMRMLPSLPDNHLMVGDGKTSCTWLACPFSELDIVLVTNHEVNVANLRGIAWTPHNHKKQLLEAPATCQHRACTVEYLAKLRTTAMHKPSDSLCSR